MQASDKPALIEVPFANSGTKNIIPTAPLPTPGSASLEVGFPPITMTPIAAGGIPPTGADFNGILYLISSVSRWAQTGGSYVFDADFATAIGGYPKGAVLLNELLDGFWISVVDNNKTRPELGNGDWVPAFNQGLAAITGLSTADVQLTAAQYAKPIITLAGTLSANINLIFPETRQQWLVVNGTVGSFSVTCKTASGSGVALAQGGAANVHGDGTGIVLPAQQVGAATASTHAVQLGQVQRSYAWNHGLAYFNANGVWTVPADVYWVDVEVWGGGGGGGGVGLSINTWAAGGGGGGGYARGVYAVTPGQVIECTVGLGGAPGRGDTGNVGTAGGTGGTTTFGSFLRASGGIGGQPNGSGNGGPGGVGSGGLLNAGGGYGSQGSPGVGAVGGIGGAGAFGGPGGGAGGGESAGGCAPGGGGGGRGSSSSGTGAVGGFGLVVIKY